MIDYRQLEAFASVVESQSFEKAARRMHLTQSAVSQRVKKFEESLGQPLIVRTQPLRPTSVGKKLLHHYQQINLLQSTLLESLFDNQSKNYTKLSIGLNADSLSAWFLDAIEPLLESNQILLDLRVEDQDRTHQLLRQGEVFGCISATAMSIQGVNCTALGSVRYRALATPEFIQRYFPNGVEAEALSRAPVAEFNQEDALQDRYLKTNFNYRGDYPRHRIPSTQAYINLIRRGLAWGMVPGQKGSCLLVEEGLRELSPGKGLSVPLYWHAWNLSSQTSYQLTECLVRYCRDHMNDL